MFFYYLTKVTYKFLDKGLLSHLGPTGFSFVLLNFVEFLIKTLTGLLYHYIILILVCLSLVFYTYNIYTYNVYILKMIGLPLYIGLLIFLVYQINIFFLQKMYLNILKKMNLNILKKMKLNSLKKMKLNFLKKKWF